MSNDQTTIIAKPSLDGVKLLSGIEAVAEILHQQARLDRQAGLQTSGFVSGYRGSPLGGLDQQFWRSSQRLAADNIRFQPGVNEELAATAVYGSQQVEFDPRATTQGVFAMWYGERPRTG